MNCNLKNMAAMAAALLASLAGAYFAFPGAQALILASAPLLVALICPVTMVVMMLTMRATGTATGVKVAPARKTPDVVPEA